MPTELTDEGRRQFLKTSALAGTALASAGGLAIADDPEKPPVPTVTLGKTGVKITKLGMGTSWKVAESFVQRAIGSGVRYIDTSETYEQGNAEKAIGNVLDRTGQRKSVYLVTKNNAYHRSSGAARAKLLRDRLDASLARLKTDYVDCYYLHGVKGSDLPAFQDPEVRKTFEALKKEGKIRFAGFSCHDALLPELIEAAVSAGWIDQMMIQFNFRTMDGEKLRRAIDKAAKANLGIIAMKTQGGSEEFPEPNAEPDRRVKDLMVEGTNFAQAAIRSVLNDERIHAVVSEMTNFTHLRENITAANRPLDAKAARLLEDHRIETCRRYCQGCGHNCEPEANGVSVADILRFYRYHEAYGKRAEARELYRSLPASSRDVASIEPGRLDASCPHGLEVSRLLREADARLGLA